MRKPGRICITTVALAIWPLMMPSSASAAGSADAARPIVVEHCAACHVVPEVNPAGRAPMPGAPAFQDIAEDRVTYPPDRIARFLGRPHFPMKGITLSPSDVENLLAYFEDLRGRPR